MISIKDDYIILTLISKSFFSSDNVEAVLEGIGSDTQNKSKQPIRYQFYDTANTTHNTPSSQNTHHFNTQQHHLHTSQNQQQQQLYSNAPPLPPGHPSSSASHHHLQLDTGDKNKQSQTLPSPNRQISRIAQNSQDSGTGIGGRLPMPPPPPYAKDGVDTNVSNIVGGSMMRRPLPPPNLKPTIQQIFPPMERAPQGIGGLPALACMKECDIEKFAADNLNLHSKGIFRKKV